MAIYCAMWTPLRKSCPHHKQRIPMTSEWDELDMQPEVQRGERQDSDWDTDLEKEKDNLTRAPVRHPRQLPNVLLYQTRKPSVGWPGGVITKPISPKPKSKTVPKQSSRFESNVDTIIVPQEMPQWIQEYEEINSKSLEEFE